jgi:hypothetical protein
LRELQDVTARYDPPQRGRLARLRRDACGVPTRKYAYCGTQHSRMDEIAGIANAYGSDFYGFAEESRNRRLNVQQVSILMMSNVQATNIRSRCPTHSRGESQWSQLNPAPDGWMCSAASVRWRSR